VSAEYCAAIWMGTWSSVGLLRDECHRQIRLYLQLGEEFYPSAGGEGAAESVAFIPRIGP
jgi:hypothetical protein